MGKFIQVNLDYLCDAMAKVDTYRSERTSLITQMSGEVNSLSSAWQAEDASAFIAHWGAMQEQDGILTLVDKQLQNYHDVLDAAYTAYKKAQQESVQKAESITSGTIC